MTYKIIRKSCQNLIVKKYLSYFIASNNTTEHGILNINILSQMGKKCSVTEQSKCHTVINISMKTSGSCDYYELTGKFRLIPDLDYLFVFFLYCFFVLLSKCSVEDNNKKINKKSGFIEPVHG